MEDLKERLDDWIESNHPWFYPVVTIAYVSGCVIILAGMVGIFMSNSGVSKMLATGAIILAGTSIVAFVMLKKYCSDFITNKHFDR